MTKCQHQCRQKVGEQGQFASSGLRSSYVRLCGHWSSCPSSWHKCKHCIANGQKSRLTSKTRGSLRCIVDFKSACFICFALMLLGPKLQCTFYLTWLLHSPLLTRALYVVLFDLKLLKRHVFERVQHCLGAPLQWGSRARAPYSIRHTFISKQLKTATCRYVCTVHVCMHKKEPQKPPEHTSECVKYQNCLGACPRTPLTQSLLWAPLFVFALGLSNPLGGPGQHHINT